MCVSVCQLYTQTQVNTYKLTFSKIIHVCDTIRSNVPTKWMLVTEVFQKWRSHTPFRSGAKQHNFSIDDNSCINSNNGRLCVDRD